MNFKPSWRSIQKHTYAIMSVMVIMGTCFLVSKVRLSEAQGGAVNWTDTIAANNPIRTIHINQMRTEINNRRNACAAPCGLGNFTFGPPVTAGDPISLSHINNLRTAVRLFIEHYDDSAPAGITDTVGTGDVIRTSDIIDLRAAIDNAEFCGDSICQSGAAGPESIALCPLDCAALPPVCGDTVCNGAETCVTCLGDCGPCAPICGDTVCNGAETCVTCLGDCGPCGCADNGPCSVDGDCCSGTCEYGGFGEGWVCTPTPGNCGPAPHFIQIGPNCVPSCGVQLGRDGLNDGGGGGCCGVGKVCAGAEASAPTWDCTIHCCENGPPTPGCVSTATCTDSIQNQGETGVDCGGPCPACVTCGDAICDVSEHCGGANECFLDCQLQLGLCNDDNDCDGIGGYTSPDNCPDDAPDCDLIEVITCEFQPANNCNECDFGGDDCLMYGCSMIG